jgi:hypothetical protein
MERVKEGGDTFVIFSERLSQVDGQYRCRQWSGWILKSTPDPPSPVLVDERLHMSTNSRPFEVFWVVTTCYVVVGYQRFIGPCCLHFQGEMAALGANGIDIPATLPSRREYELL